MIKTPDFTPEQIAKIRKKIAIKYEISMAMHMLSKRPNDLIRLFILHPRIIISYVYNKFLK